MDTTRTASRRLSLLAAASLIAWTGAAHAEGSTDLEEVVVTAQKRAERLEDVPIAITAVSGAQLERAGMTRLEDISRIAAGVQISRTGSYTQPAIRGVSTTRAFLPENNVATYLDGVYLASSRGLNLDLVNIASIQVLKGPQGTLFGRNATGGAILIETLKPSLTETTGRFSATYARFDDKRLQAYVSTPVSDIFAVALTGQWRATDGYIKDVSGFDTAPYDSYTLALRGRLEPSDSLSLDAKVETSRVSDGRGQAGTAVGRTLSRALFPTTPIATERNRTSLNHPVIADVYSNSASLKAEYRMDKATLTSISSYQLERNFAAFESDGSPRPIYDQYLRERSKYLSQEVNLTSATDGPLQYVLGLFYFESKIRIYDNNARSYPATVFTRQASAFQTDKAYAAYGDLTWQASDRLFLTAGLRYSHEEQDFFRWAADGALLINQPATFESTTPRAVIRYQIAEDANVYASYSKGFKSGLINNAPPYTVVRPEKIDAYEVGFKAAKGRYRFDASAYYYDYKDLQTGTVILINGVTNTVTANAATAEIYGAEAQFNGRLTDKLNAYAGIAYTHARYKEFPNAVVALPNPVTGLNSETCANPTPPPATRTCTQDWAGQRLARAPDWSINVGGDYTIDTGMGDLVLAANGAYTSAFAPTRSDKGLDGTGYRLQQGDTFVLNLSAAWTLPDRRWTLTAFGTNVTDEQTYIALTAGSFGDFQVQGEPAVYGVRVDYRF